MNAKLTPGAPVKVVRPGKKQHGWLGRLVEQEGPHAWVAFTAAPAVAAPDTTDTAKLRKARHLLRFPTSQLDPL